MKYMIVVLVMASVLSCKMENKTKEVDEELAKPKTVTNLDADQYPKPLLKVFEAQGGNRHLEEKKEFGF